MRKIFKSYIPININLNIYVNIIEIILPNGQNGTVTRFGDAEMDE